MKDQGHFIEKKKKKGPANAQVYFQSPYAAHRQAIEVWNDGSILGDMFPDGKKDFEELSTNTYLVDESLQIR